jgi:translation initiation factor IF-3
VLVIDENGGQLGQLPTAEALRIAQERGLDLVEVNPTAVPPVCRLMDWGRQQYEQSRREREAKKNQTKITIKEVRVSPKTDPHDKETKLRAITEWLRKGDRVQLTLRMRGREQAHPDVGRKVLSEMASAVGDVGRVERDVVWEGRRMTMVLAPNSMPVKGGKPARQPAAPTETAGSRPAEGSQ